MSRHTGGLVVSVGLTLLGWLLFAGISAAQSDYVHWFRPAALGWAGGAVRLYADTPGFRNPPWTVLLLLPFALLPAQLGAGLVRLLAAGSAALAAHALARGRLARWLGTLLTLCSFPALDALYRVQLGGFVIWGVVLGQMALCRRSPSLLVAALLLAAVKPQVSVLLMALWVWIALRHWSVRSRRCVVACGLGGVALTLVIFGPGWPLDWLGALRDVLEPNHPALLSSPWAACRCLGLPSWTPALLALVLGLVGGPPILRTRGRSSLTAGWMIALCMLLVPYQHPFDSLVLLAVTLAPVAEISLPASGILYLLSYTLPLYVLGLPHWLGAALPVGVAVVLTGLCRQGGIVDALTPGAGGG